MNIPEKSRDEIFETSQFIYEKIRNQQVFSYYDLKELIEDIYKLGYNDAMESTFPPIKIHD